MWARIKDNKVIEITDIAPKGRFVKEIEKEFIEVPGDVKQGDIYENGKFKQPTKTLDELKEEKWEEIKNLRNQKEEAGFPYKGNILDSDALSIQRITIAVQAAQAALNAKQEFAIDWTCHDNSILTMNADDVCGIPLALALHSNELHQKSRTLREQIEKAATEEELEAVHW